jgi:hypothetical protein
MGGPADRQPRGRKLHAYFLGGNGEQVYIGIPDLDKLI